MTTAIARQTKQKSDFRELRKLAEQQMREMEKKMREMDTFIARLKAAVGEGPPQPSPLDQVHELLKATEDLRVGNGKLSAAAVARAFGVSVNELAGWLGRSRQSLAKTPDADSLQNELAFFERVARLRAVVPPDRFLKWLRMPNAQLDGETPLKLMAQGERQVVVDFVEDMLTGAPT
jgi:transcriptional regulator with XRE-family HTH domain